MQRLNVHKLVRDLNELCNTLIDQYSINSGGCCYVAYEIARHLDRFHIRYSLCIVDEYVLNLNAVIREVRNKCGHLVTGINTCWHYYITIQGGGPINESDFDEDYNVYTITGIDHTNIIWLYKQGDWNPTYNPKNNRLIKKVIGTYFKQYEKKNLHTFKSITVSKM